MQLAANLRKFAPIRQLHAPGLGSADYSFNPPPKPYHLSFTAR